jgi:predicted transcriptional regulator
MRTTIRLNGDVLSQAKQLAARTGRTLTAVIEDALRHEFASLEERRRAAHKVKLPFWDGGGVQPGVNLDSNAELRELMEREE